MVGSKPPRSLVEPPEFQQQRDALLPIRMFDALMVGVTWTLVRGPERYADPENLTLGVVTTNPFPGIPRFRIFYEFDSEQVVLKGIELYDDEV